ncbi:GAF domain-containing sensor histidine kinase [Hoeflea ulvae]|uniref:histidine kinase n=1 Tax=Hoeflea ulvae TaxID=2983764 RepID=A0ABT3Y9Z9_9HYPH|nr:GAF domain-containing sensor histidine kinase [Hoeflea ulvae]MCY0092708.1 GAF domain-containing sensor histidine kinase [Hoeflea ulvae]
MNEIAKRTALQSHAAYLAGDHDFQSDIDIMTGSEVIGTVLETIMLATNMRFAAVARVTADRWVACRTVDEVNFGLVSGDEIEIRSTFCQSVRTTGQRVLFNDVATDDVYQNHPIAMNFGIVSYASIPIYRSDGSFFGTLCAIDTEVRDVKHPRVVAMLEMFASVISQTLENEEQLAAQELLLRKERELAQIQEEFVAVLGHDLRNPVAAFGAGLRQLERHPEPGKITAVLPLMRSSMRRMNELIDNIMMHAKSRLGGGIRIAATPDAPLAQAINDVVEEIRMAAPQHRIDLDLRFDGPVHCDASRIAQAVSNLLSNATNHATPGSAIAVTGTDAGGEVSITVSNRGEPIPDNLIGDLFRPFRRGQKATSEGLGLGLFIAASIARAHNGSLDVECQDGITAFALKLPRPAGNPVLESETPGDRQHD